MTRLRRWYGAGPLHLLVMLASLALAAYAGVRWLSDDPLGVLLWFAGAVLLHDMVLLPLYSLADRALSARLGDRGRRLPRGAALNAVRVPALLSGLLLLVWFPLVLRLPGSRYTATTGLSLSPYLGRWLLVSGALFAVSAAVLALRLLLARRSRGPAGDR